MPHPPTTSSHYYRRQWDEPRPTEGAGEAVLPSPVALRRRILSAAAAAPVDGARARFPTTVRGWQRQWGAPQASKPPLMFEWPEANSEEEGGSESRSESQIEDNLVEMDEDWLRKRDI